LVEEIVKACEWFQPDLVHIWGIERFWGLLTARGYIRVPVLLEMQGDVEGLGKTFYGGSYGEGTIAVYRHQRGAETEDNCFL